MQRAVCIPRRRARANLIGAEIAQFFERDEAARFHKLLGEKDGLRISAEFTLRTATGGVVPVNISLVELSFENGAPEVVCGVVTDLGLIRKRADELAVANAKLAAEIEERIRAQGSLQLALDAAKMGSWDIDLRRGAATRTVRHDNIFGYVELQPDWSLETTIAHILPEDRAAVVAAFKDSGRSRRVDFEARIRRADDGSTRWLHITGQTFYENGEPVRIAGVVADVTDRRAVEERLRQAQKLEAIGQLTGGVAHDFNNLLMVISGGLDMLDHRSDPARRDRITSGMRQAVARGSALSRQLLAFSRKQALRSEPIDLARQIGGMQELLDRSLRGDVQVKTELPDGLWPVEVDPGELELVVLNLAVNARDAMPEGGQITISAVNVPGRADGEYVGDYVRLSVADTGTGMPPDVITRVFEPFFTTKEVGRGSGLGLAQTHGFVRSSGGDVRINSVLGKGTEISLFLPRSLKSPVAPAERTHCEIFDKPRLAASAGDVLIVEDDDEVAALTIEMFEHLGFQVTRVAGAEAALGALANGRKINLLFSDVMMPGAMNGIELAHQFRIRRPDLPVLLTSGHAQAAQRQAETFGFRLLPKPYRLEELATAVKTLNSR